MNSFSSSITESLLYLELNNIDSLETTRLLKSRGTSYGNFASIQSDGKQVIIPNSRLGKINVKAPPDKLYIAALVAFSTGLIELLPLKFYIVANDYWMYKFRDTADQNYNLNNKTYLQKTFISMMSVCTALPSLISVILTAKYSHKMGIRRRFLLSLGFLCCVFLIFTLIVDVNTDKCQTIFFVFTLTMFGFTSSIQPFYGMTSLAYLSKFPPFYMKLNMLGSAIGGLFSTILQIISLSIGHTSTQIALIYFSSGMVVVGVTFFFSYVMKYSTFIKFYLDEANQEKKESTYSTRNYWEVAKNTWFFLLIVCINVGTSNFAHPNITNLVVSEGYTGTGQNLWYDKYFVVAATYLLNDIFQVLGRFFGRPLIKRKNATYFIILAVLRSFVLTPLLWFCNAQPRHNLPVIFTRDYQYMILLALNSFTGSVFVTTIFLSIPKVAEEKTEQAFTLLIVVVSIVITISSPLSPIYVHLL